MFLKKSLRISLFCILNYLTIDFSFGQVLNFDQLTSKDGLPSAECYKVIQDKKGYIWVFSEYGIVKHNGERFTAVCTNIALKDQNAYSVFETESGEIYFSNSFSKIFKVRNDSAISIHAIEKFTQQFTLPEEIVFEIVVDKNKDIYFSSYKSSYCYRVATNKIENLYIPHDIKDKVCIYKKVGDHFFTFTSSPFNKQNCNIQIFDEKKVIKNKLYLESFYEGRKLKKVNNFYLLTTSNFVYKISESGVVQSKMIAGIVGFFIDKADQIWLYTNDGLLLLNQQLDVIAQYLEGKVVSDICFDNKNGMWVTTIGQGVFYCKNNEEIACANTDLKNKEIFFIKKEENSIFLASVDGNCYKYTDSSFKQLHSFDNSAFCGDITNYKDGYILSTKKGVFLKSKNGNLSEFKDSKGLSLYSNYVKTINSNEFLSFGGSSIYHFSGNKLINSGILTYKIYCVTYHDTNRYLVGTKNGIFIYNHKTNAFNIYNDFFANKFIMTMVYDNYGNLWVGTRGDGLFAITKKNEVFKYENAPFYVVKDIDFVEDKIIVSTNLGVFVNSKNGTSIIDDWIRIFDSEINSVEILNENLWLASKNGLYSMSFSNLPTSDLYPLVINSIYADSRRIPEGLSVLSYDENDLRFNFDFLNYKSKVKNFYFRLNGPTKLSGTISGNVLQIQNLSPGSYQLEVYPYHGPVYNPIHFISKSFFITPAFWQTYWFKAFIFLMIVSVSGCIVALYFNSKRKREKKSAEINKLLAEYKLTALKAQINPHFISNSLSAIQLLIDSGEIDKANQYIAKFSLLIRYVLKYSDKSVSRLSDELKIIELNVDLEQLRFMNSFIFKMDIEENIDTNEIFVPPLITQPFIENAIWHGLIPLKSRPPQLTLKIRKKNDFLVISIIDNGIGRMNSEKNSSLANNSARESMGTTLIQNRIDNLNQLHNSKVAEVNIIDIFDTDSVIAGTQVNIVLSIAALSKF